MSRQTGRSRRTAAEDGQDEHEPAAQHAEDHDGDDDLHEHAAAARGRLFGLAVGLGRIGRSLLDRAARVAGALLRTRDVPTRRRRHLRRLAHRRGRLRHRPRRTGFVQAAAVHRGHAGDGGERARQVLVDGLSGEGVARLVGGLSGLRLRDAGAAELAKTGIFRVLGEQLEPIDELGRGRPRRRLVGEHLGEGLANGVLPLLIALERHGRDAILHLRRGICSDAAGCGRSSRT